MRISIIGLGKLGTPMAAVMAHKGHTVVGVDINPQYVKAIQEGRSPVNEPQLAEMIEANRERLTATESYEEAILATDLTFIIVPTPSDADGRFSMKYVLQAAEKIGQALRKKAAWHLVVLSSTVMPGSSGGELLPALDRHSGKLCARGFRPLLQPGVHRAGQRGAGHVEAGHDSDRRIGCAVGRNSGGVVRRGLRKQSEYPADELRQRGADQAFGEHVRHHENHLTPTCWRRFARRCPGRIRMW